jgi:hypothetical protein
MRKPPPPRSPTSSDLDAVRARAQHQTPPTRNTTRTHLSSPPQGLHPDIFAASLPPLRGATACTIAPRRPRPSASATASPPPQPTVVRLLAQTAARTRNPGGAQQCWISSGGAYAFSDAGANRLRRGEGKDDRVTAIPVARARTARVICTHI